MHSLVQDRGPKIRATMTISFTIRGSFQQLLEQARGDLLAAMEVVSRYESAPDATLDSWGGEILKPMKESFQVLLRGLRHSSMQLRLTGLFLVRDHWPQLEEAVSECLRMAFDDSDPVVRGTALWILRRFYAWIDDPAALLNQVLSVTLD